MHVIGNVEYVALRLVRRFLLRDAVLMRLGRLLPYYQPSANETEPEAIAREYVRLCQVAGQPLGGRSVLEVGAGRTNAVGYALAGHGIRSYTAFEPYAPFDAAGDAGLRQALQGQTAEKVPRTALLVQRVACLDGVESQTMDAVFSNSVLEHVRDLDALIAGSLRVLRPGGSMLHIVDYRDHFFNCPFHFLQFSARVWQRFLDPGDLPRWRLNDHVAAFAAHGCSVRVLDQVSDLPAFSRIKPWIHPDFHHYDDLELATTKAVLLVCGGSSQS